MNQDKKQRTATKMPWWNDAVFYEVFVRSFKDSNGDGIGDLKGLIEKLDYLEELGVGGIWLMPIMQSPTYHGYDIVDYYQIQQEYGTKEDFLCLVDEAHKRHIRVIVDLVLNHTSNEHPWFQEARDEPTAKRRNWYVWSKKKPDWEGWHPTENGYYYGCFWGGMPDLNYGNPAVTAAMLEVTRFWLSEMRVDGFRLDAIKHLYERESIIEHTFETHAWLKDFHRFCKAINPQALIVGEIWSPTDIVASYVPDQVDIAFEFDLAKAILESGKLGRKVKAKEDWDEAKFVEKTMLKVVDTYPPGQFATFLANHDQERTRSQLLNDEQAKVAATIQLTAPGVPFIYYGEEIGMQGQKPDENIRRPMQWTGEPGGGFTTGEAWHSFYEDYQERHVSAQRSDPDSIFNHYRALIALRKEHEALRIGEWTRLETSQEQLYAFLRHTENQALLVMVNLSEKELATYSLHLESGPLTDISQVKLLFGQGDITAPTLNADGGLAAYEPLDKLPPYSSFVIQLGS